MARLGNTEALVKNPCKAAGSAAVIGVPGFARKDRAF